MHQYSPLNASKIPAGFGTFPYFILQVFRNVFVQIPLVFDIIGNQPDAPLSMTIHISGAPPNVLTDLQQRGKIMQLIKDATRKMAGNSIANRNIADDGKYKDTACIVLSPEYAIYYEKGNFIESTSIPEGGALMTTENKMIAMNSQHYCSDAIPFLQKGTSIQNQISLRN